MTPYFPKSREKQGRFGPWVFVVVSILFWVGALGVYLVKVNPDPLRRLIGDSRARAQEAAPETPTDAAPEAKSAEPKTEQAEGIVPVDTPTPPAGQAEKDAQRFHDEKMSEIRQDITNQLNEIKSIQKTLDQRLTDQKEKNESERLKQLAKLIKIIASMRPEDAARVLSESDEDLAVIILSSLTGAKSSKILGAMSAPKAASLSAKMVKLKPDPKIKDLMENWQQKAEAPPETTEPTENSGEQNKPNPTQP